MKKQIRELFTTQTQKKIQSFDNLFICSLTHTQESASYKTNNKTKTISFNPKGYYYTKFTSLKGVFFICKTNLAPKLAFRLLDGSCHFVSVQSKINGEKYFKIINIFMMTKIFKTLGLGVLMLGILFPKTDFAQEKKMEFVGGIGIGNSNFINYSPVSFLGNVNETTNSFLYNVNFGCNFKHKIGFDFKLRLNQSNFIQNRNQSNLLEEQSSLVYIGVAPKLIFPLVDKIDIVTFVGMGIMLQGSSIDLNGNSYVNKRIGTATNLGLSLNYELTNKLYISATLETLLGNLDKCELQSELKPFKNNNLSQLKSYDFSLSINFKL